MSICAQINCILYGWSFNILHCHSRFSIAFSFPLNVTGRYFSISRREIVDSFLSHLVSSLVPPPSRSSVALFSVFMAFIGGKHFSQIHSQTGKYFMGAPCGICDIVWLWATLSQSLWIVCTHKTCSIKFFWKMTIIFQRINFHLELWHTA